MRGVGGHCITCSPRGMALQSVRGCGRPDLKMRLTSLSRLCHVATSSLASFSACVSALSFSLHMHERAYTHTHTHTHTQTDEIAQIGTTGFEVRCSLGQVLQRLLPRVDKRFCDCLLCLHLLLLYALLTFGLCCVPGQLFTCTASHSGSVSHPSRASAGRCSVKAWMVGRRMPQPRGRLALEVVSGQVAYHFWPIFAYNAAPHNS